MKLLMLRPTVLLTVAALAAPAWADMDHEAERRRQAERNAAAQAAAKKQQEANAIRHDAMMRGYRQMLGPKAAGKSDAEVVQMVQQMQGDAAEVARRHDIALVLDETYRSFRATEGPAHALYAEADWSDHVIGLFSFSK